MKTPYSIKPTTDLVFGGVFHAKDRRMTFEDGQIAALRYAQTETVSHARLAADVGEATCQQLAALIHQQHPVGEALHQVHLVRAQQDRHARVPQVPDEPEERRRAGLPHEVLGSARAGDDDAPAMFSRADFTFDTWQLAVPLGLVSLGPGLFVIQDAAFVHVAAEISATSGDVVFGDETQAIGEGVTWGFHVFEGSADEAVALARRINAQRRVVR